MKMFSVAIVAALYTGLGGAQQAPPPAAAGHASCRVQTSVAPSEADQALADGHFADAEKLYAAMPPSSAATAGLIRAELGERRLADALALALKESAAHPNDALLLDALGEVRFRRGEVQEAAMAIDRSGQLDPCLAQTYFDRGRYLNLEGMFKSAQVQLEMAHKLAPGDAQITRAWESTHQVPLTADQEIAQLEQRAANPDATEEQKTAIAATIKRLQAREKGDCRLRTPVDTAKIDMMPLGNPTDATGGLHAVGLDVFLNGKRKRLELDTGASGLLLTHEAAKSLGLTPEAETRSSGVGDEGVRNAFATHVDSIKIGGMEFGNCMVQVVETRNVLAGQDGLIGSDVFRSFVVSLDFPRMEVKLSPLPKRPDEAAQTASLGTESDETEGKSIAESRQDRYVAPEMKDWYKVFRSGHFLIFPTSIGKAPRKLFVMDTGAGLNLISPEAAREVTGVSTDDAMHVRGVSGEVKNVLGTGNIVLEFGNVRLLTGGMTAIDTTRISRSTGVELSGFIGFPVLRELKIEIDYRDNLVHLVYEPHHGSTAR